MNVSLSWLRQFLTIHLPEEEIVSILTKTGLEVEGVETWEQVPGSLKGVVIGEVLEVKPHPGADRLRLTQVCVGNDTNLTIVCGAPNVSVGQKVAVATVGSTLYPLKGEPIEIKKSKIRGEVSEGMICAEDELGIGSSHDGIMVLPAELMPGLSFAEFYGVRSDRVISIGLTPNRIDAASHFGVARELVAAFHYIGVPVSLEVNTPDMSIARCGHPSYPVSLQSKSCGRYSGVLLGNIKVGDSPDWLKSKLLAIGVKPINTVVDVTNFVLHEYGQPLHAFDADKISGSGIVVRNARSSEKLVTLDGIERTLLETDLVICDTEKPLCLAGIYGGRDSGISSETSRVFLESAWFSQVSIRKSSRHHGLKTDASFRYERGTSPDATLPALFRAVQLLIEISGAAVQADFSDDYPEPFSDAVVDLSPQFFASVAGYTLWVGEMANILKDLDFEILECNDDLLKVRVPAYRVDVNRPIDVVEEIMRIVGFDDVPLSGTISVAVNNEVDAVSHNLERKCKNFLVGNGFFEAMTISMGPQKTAGFPVVSDSLQPIHLLNPLSQELSVMRRNLLHGLVSVLVYNSNRQRPDGKFFEVGKVYGDSGNGITEKKMLAMVWCGQETSSSWGRTSNVADFYSAKGCLEALFTVSGHSNLASQAVESSELLSYGLHISPTFRGSQVNSNTALVGEVSREFLESLGADFKVFYAEIDLQEFESIRTVKSSVNPLPKFPEVKRDLSLLIDKSVTFSKIREVIFQSERKLLRSVNLFDVYEGKNLPQEKKSYALSLVLAKEDATLTEAQIESVLERVIKGLEKEIGATLRS